MLINCSLRYKVLTKLNKNKRFYHFPMSVNEEILNKNKLDQATNFIKLNDFKKAKEILLELANKNILDPTVYLNLAFINFQKGEKDEMQEILIKAVNLGIRNTDIFTNLGNIFFQKRNFDQAIIFFKEAINSKPDNFNVQYNLGCLFIEKKDYANAINSLKNALKINPNFAKAYNNLGTIYQFQGDLNTAEIYFLKALKINPKNLTSLTNLALLFREQGNLKKAKSYLEKVLKINPNYPEARFNLSIIQFLNNNYTAGWINYQWRWRLNNQHDAIQIYAKPQAKEWIGENLNPGEKLFIASEQGLGDTIQFMRYIPYLRKKGIHISFCAQTKLHQLIKESDISNNPLPPKKEKFNFDGKWAPLLSLPKYLNIDSSNPVVKSPYLKINKDRISYWKNIFSNEKKPIIGINWQGKLRTEENNHILKGRSMPLEFFSRLTCIDNFKFLSLQHGYGSEQIANCSFKEKFVDFQGKINESVDFVEKAAIILNCSIIITTDTSIAHLSGACGKKTLLLLKKVPDWRWGIKGKKTFWYENMELFRQKEKDNWQEVMDRVLIRLVDILNS